MRRRDPSQPVASENLLEFFTNREGPLERVHELSRPSSEEDLKALVFWGVAGIGKSTLLAKLAEDLQGTMPVARCDLRSLPRATEVDRGALVHLRAQLGDQGASFPRFDTCLAAQGVAEGRDPPPLLAARPGFRLAWAFVRDYASLGLLGHVEEGLRQQIQKRPKIAELVRKVGGTAEVVKLSRRAREQDPTLAAGGNQAVFDSFGPGRAKNAQR